MLSNSIEKIKLLVHQLGKGISELSLMKQVESQELSLLKIKKSLPEKNPFNRDNELKMEELGFQTNILSLRNNLTTLIAIIALKQWEFDCDPIRIKKGCQSVIGLFFNLLSYINFALIQSVPFQLLTLELNASHPIF
jgi:hypothetical protein